MRGSIFHSHSSSLHLTDLQSRITEGYLNSLKLNVIFYLMGGGVYIICNILYVIYKYNVTGFVENRNLRLILWLILRLILQNRAINFF